MFLFQVRTWLYNMLWSKFQRASITLYLLYMISNANAGATVICYFCNWSITIRKLYSHIPFLESSNRVGNTANTEPNNILYYLNKTTESWEKRILIPLIRYCNLSQRLAEIIIKSEDNPYKSYLRGDRPFIHLH